GELKPKTVSVERPTAEAVAVPVDLHAGSLSLAVPPAGQVQRAGLSGVGVRELRIDGPRLLRVIEDKRHRVAAQVFPNFGAVIGIEHLDPGRPVLVCAWSRVVADIEDHAPHRAARVDSAVEPVRPQLTRPRLGARADAA